MATKKLISRKQHARALQKTITTTRQREKEKEGPVNSRDSAIPITKEAIGYEEAVLRNIINNAKGASVPDEAFMLSTVLSSLSAGMKETNYRHGVSLGRMLYKIKGSGKNYLLPEESIIDLVEFFQSAGHKNVSFTAFPGNDIEIRMYDKHGPKIGTTLHSFEAGIISGFLSSVNHRYVSVTEKTCVNENGSYCRFSENRGEPEHHADSTMLLGKIVEHVADSSHGKRNHTSCIKNDYYLLESLPLLDPAYLDSIKDIATYVGKSIGDKLNHLNGKARIAVLQKAIKLLNFGTPTIMGIRPLRMRLNFSKMGSKHEFIDISLAFINGLLSNSMQNEAVAVERSANGSYVVEIKERKSETG